MDDIIGARLRATRNSAFIIPNSALKKARRPYSPRASQIIVLNYAAFFLVQTNAAAAATETAAKAAMPAADE
ncbi:MAG: hypothetical protein IKS39_09355, partial [Clostridia bacterium]|nr:hypothetical protein [Clostridia bacterium]